MTNNPFEDEREVDEIRAKLCEDYDSIGPEAWHRKISDNAHALAKQYGFKIVPSLTDDLSAARAA